jgi:hypothetical protein
MIKMSDGVLDVNPLERMDRLEDIRREKKSTISSKKKELEELEKAKKIELEQLDIKKRLEIEELEDRKKKELEKLDIKRKELEDLENKKIKEIQETQELIERSFQDLMRHKILLLKEDEDKELEKREKSESLSLEEVAKTAPKIEQGLSNLNYGKFFETMQAPQRLYDITNNSFYNGLTELRNKAASGQITPEEELFVTRLRDQFEQFNSNQSYIEKDQNQYIRRSMSVIEQISNYQRIKID